MHSADLAKQDYFRELAARLGAAKHGERGELVAQAAEFMSMTKQRVYRELRAVGWSSGKRVRADRGNTRISDDELRTIATIMTESTRTNGKRLLGVADAMEIALANGMISTTVSPTTALRIMRARGMHPDQIARATPHTEMRSLHPNHVWQFDVSVCVLFYLDTGGLAVMEEKKFYKNKPANLQRVSKQRVLRYLITDHYSGALYLHYYMGSGETQEILFEFLMAAMTKRAHDQDPFHGAPMMFLWDAGSANTGALIKNMMQQLDIPCITHTPGSPRVKGQVEGTHNIVERKFEGRLFMMKIRDIDHLNNAAHTWMRHFNGTQIHRRHGHTRYGLWQTIREDQLRICPPREVCEQLLHTKPERRQVRGELKISFAVKNFGSNNYSVAHIPNVRVGDYVSVCVNPYEAPNVFVIMEDEEGRERHYACVPDERNEAGYCVDSPVWGESYRAPADTDVDTHRKQMAKQAYDADTELEVERARAKKTPAFGGRVDPVGYLEEQTTAHYMPRRGTDMDVPDRAHVEIKPLSIAEACKRLIAELGPAPEGVNYYALVKSFYPDGVPDDEFDALKGRINQQPVSTGLRVVS